MQKRYKYALFSLCAMLLIILASRLVIAQIDKKGMKEKYTNALINETSPYLLQHAHNPVNWYPWGEEALKKAENEDKLLLISVGYSACHWCHVMEHESFENEEIAKLMNEMFVCIKVDREERPDIDQIYMDAVQMITGRGGWPLNCFALPDGRPFYGGTYFPSDNWVKVLKAIYNAYVTEKDKVLRSANQVSEGVRVSGLIETKESQSVYTIKELSETVETWKSNFDRVNGGENRAPKFPIPISLDFLMNYYFYTKDSEVFDHLNLSLDKIAEGGIYDQIGGGFSRYSVDEYWKVPHFEKMLYDNAQLLSLYSNAYRLTKKNLYKNVVVETIEFLERELALSNGGFYSALDADSEGVEGKFYVWEKENVDRILGKDSEIFSDYFEVKHAANWEEGNILHIKQTKSDLLEKYQISEKYFDRIVSESKQKLLQERGKRIRPGLDDKFLTSWNAMLIKGYVDAYEALGDDSYLNKAIQIADFIRKEMLQSDVQLLRTYKNGDARINAFLDDYSFTLEAFVALYQVTFDEIWLKDCEVILEYLMLHFYDKKSGMFFYTSDEDTQLVARKMEVMDNVTPSSNASMAEVLFSMGNLLGRNDYLEISRQMLANMKEHVFKYIFYHGKWGNLMLKQIYTPFELVILGEKAKKYQREFNKNYYPNVIVLGSEKESDLPLLKNRFSKKKTSFYLCKDKSCFLPTSNIDEIIERINNEKY
ncbi:thioredoxin domain-containing protein [Ancylomarina sp. DW003]|nr:thioredoxin domain-containing protein [Ancylomarina sp. DW003]MDE5421775.1 thioredoxin domain-containing protein [Ancylomarina sp. DW003]